MNSKSCVVLGEAQESESEEEIYYSTVPKDSVQPRKGKVVFGEAPESDEENCTSPGSVESISSAVSALSLPSVKERHRTSKKHQSILVKKLYERNTSLNKNLNEFIEQTATNAGNELNAANRRLLKCQVQMQEGTDYLRMLNSTLAALDTNLKLLLSTQYFPAMRVDDSAEHLLQAKPP